MSVIKFANFFCELPRIAGVKLPEGFAAKAVNTDVSSGILRGFQTAGSSTLPAKTKAALFYDAGRTYTWNEDADAVRSPVTDVTGGRFYWTSASSDALQVSTTYAADEYKTYAATALAQAQAYKNAGYSGPVPNLVLGWAESRGITNTQAANAILATVNTALTPQSMVAWENIPVGFYEQNGSEPYYRQLRRGMHSDITGVPRPPKAPVLFELTPVIGHLVADFEIFLANERKSGALTEVTSLTVGDMADANSNYNVDPIDEAAVDTLMQSVVYKVNPRGTEYVLAKPGQNRVNDLLRTEYAYWRGHNTALWQSGTPPTRPAFSSPALYGKAVIGGVYDGEKDSGLGTGTTLARWKGGTEVDVYYADDASTLYIRATGDLAKGEFIRDVAPPTFAANSGNWFDFEKGEYLTLAATKGRVTFRRCHPRDGDYTSSWYYYTMAYCPHPSLPSGVRQPGITPSGSTATHEQLKEWATAFPDTWGQCIAYKIALTPVIANDTDGAGGTESLGPVVVMDAWLAERDQPILGDDGMLYGKITGAPYVEGDQGIFIDDMEFRGRVDTAGSAWQQSQTRIALRAKLTKVRATFRLDGKHSIPEQLKAVTSNYVLPDLATLVNNVQPWPADKYFLLSMQTKYEATEARSYVVTYVNTWGEEGAPSDPLLITDVPKDGRIRLRVPVWLWDNHRCAPIQKVRLYRTATGSQNTEYLYAGEWAIGGANDSALLGLERTGALVTEVASMARGIAPFIYGRYEYIRPGGRVFGSGYATENDRPTVASLLNGAGFVYLVVADTKRTDELAEPLSTQTYSMPPCLNNLTGGPLAASRPSCLRLMHNGMLAFMEGGNVWITEPYLPYACNPAAVQNLPHDVVTLCPTENYLFAGTKGEPFLLVGNTPDTITNQRVPSVQAAVSKWGSARVGDGVIYASPDGLVLTSGLSADLSLSSRLFTAEKWKAMFPHQDAVGLAVQDNFVFVWCHNALGGYAGIIDLSNPQAGITRYDPAGNDSNAVLDPVRNAIQDPFRDTLHLARQQSVETLFSGGARTAFRHMTRRVELPKPESMSVVQVLGTGTVTVTVKRFNPSASSDGPATDVMTQTLALSSRNWFRLPGGSVSRWWIVEVVGAANAEVFSIIVASSMQELKSA